MEQIASPLTAGTTAPSFSTTVQNGTERSLSDYAGKKLALYFYPRDMTPGCTAQACNLTENYDALAEAGISILGVSPDPAAKHQKFIDKYGIRFDFAEYNGILLIGHICFDCLYIILQNSIFMFY